ncbi:MAG: autotransporter outer membrane beta-barrel domain-containing protein [Planctomycetaceae bacterium]|jgi:hypothetical protein|nr:autotransporter outer membrane beta-barrel domain-containing protein [Planctomycetaceae bacterium]
MNARMQQNLVKFLKQAVIHASLLTLYILLTINNSYAQGDINPNIPPYYSAIPNSVVAAELNGGIFRWNNTLWTPTGVGANWNFPNFNFPHTSNIMTSNTYDNVIGVLTNNRNSAFTFSGSYFNVINEKSGGFAGGIIYYAQDRFDGSINSLTTPLSVTSQGESLGVGFLDNNNGMNGKVNMSNIYVTSNISGNATGILANNIVDFYDPGPPSYSFGEINADSIYVTANNGNAYGIYVNNIIKTAAAINYTTTDRIDVTFDYINVAARNSATGITINSVGFGTDINLSVVSVASTTAQATGINVANIGGTLTSSSSSFLSSSSISFAHVGVHADLLGGGSGDAIGVNVGQIGDNVTIGGTGYYEYQDYDPDPTFSSNITVDVISESGAATGVRLGNIGVGSEVTIDKITAMSNAMENNNKSIGLHITGDIGTGTTIHYDYDDYTDYTLGGYTIYNKSRGIIIESAAGSGDAIGVLFEGVIGKVATESSSNYSYSSSSVQAEVHIGAVAATSDTGGVIGVQISDVNGTIKVDGITATSTTSDTDEGRDVYGFILNGTIAPITLNTSNQNTKGGIVEIGAIESKIEGGKGNVFGLVSNGEIPISGTLKVSDISVATKGIGAAIGVDLVNGIKANIGDPSIPAPVLNLTGTVAASSVGGSAYGIRIGVEPIEDLIISKDVTAESESSLENSHAIGIYATGGKNNISIDTQYSNSLLLLPQYVKITGAATNENAEASIYLNGTDNKLVIGLANSLTLSDETFTNNGEKFNVFGAQEIIFNVKSNLTNKSKFIGSEKVTINANLTLSNIAGNESYFDEHTKEIFIAENITADFGASQFRNKPNETYGLELTAKGNGIFHYDQVFNGINGIDGINAGVVKLVKDGNNSDAFLDAYFIGPGNFRFGGRFIADNVIVEKFSLVNPVGGVTNAGTQSIGILETGILTINSGTMEIINDSVNETSRNEHTYKAALDKYIDFSTISKIKGLEGNGNVNNSSLTGSDSSVLEIDASSDHIFSGLLQMGYIIKKGAGKQTVNRLITPNFLTINGGEFAITGDADIAGIKNDAGAGNKFTVGGNLIIDVGIDEIIKVFNPSQKTFYKYLLRDYTFAGNLDAGNITKKGKGIQRFNSINTQIITFGQGTNDSQSELDEAIHFDSITGELIDFGQLVATNDLPVGGILVASQSINFSGIEGEEGILRDSYNYIGKDYKDGDDDILGNGIFTLTTSEDHSSKALLYVSSLLKSGQGNQYIGKLVADSLVVNEGGIIVKNFDASGASGKKFVSKDFGKGNIDITNGIDGVGGYVEGLNVTINNKDNKDHFFGGNLTGYNITKNGDGLQTFKKLETTNNLNINKGQIYLNQIVVDGTLSLAKDTKLELYFVNKEQINAKQKTTSGSFINQINNGADDTLGTIVVHGAARANTVGIQFGSGADMNKVKIAFKEEPDQFITWKLGSDRIYAAANEEANMSESYLTSLLLHDHAASWNAIAKRLDQLLPASGSFFRTNPARFNQFLGQSPTTGNVHKSFWLNYTNRFGEHKSDFYNNKFKLRSNGIQIGYDIIPSQTFQYGLLFGYEGQSSTISRDKIDADDTYVGLYGTKILTCGIDLRAMIGYGHQAYNSTRYAKNSNTPNKTKYNGDTVEGIIEIGRRFGWNQQLTFRPVFAVELYYNMINRSNEDNNFDNAVTYDLATLKQTMLRFGNGWRYEINQLIIGGGSYYTFNCGTDKLTTIVVDDFGQRLPLNGSKLGRSIINFDLTIQYFANELQTKSVFINLSNNLYIDRKNTPFTGTFQIGFQSDF